MNNAGAVNLKNDHGLIDVCWFGSNDKVMAQFRRMLNNGWYVTVHGVTSIDEKGRTVVAKPVKLPGCEATGIATWFVDDEV